MNEVLRKKKTAPAKKEKTAPANSVFPKPGSKLAVLSNIHRLQTLRDNLLADSKQERDSSVNSEFSEMRQMLGRIPSVWFSHKYPVVDKIESEIFFVVHRAITAFRDELDGSNHGNPSKFSSAVLTLDSKNLAISAKVLGLDGKRDSEVIVEALEWQRAITYWSPSGTMIRRPMSKLYDTLRDLYSSAIERML